MQAEGWLATRESELERQSFEQSLGIGTDDVHQAQRFAIGADENVLAVVQRMPIYIDAARPAAGLFRGLKNNGFDARAGQFNSRSETGPASANDRDFQPLIQVRQAIHSLRTGVSEVRWVST